LLFVAGRARSGGLIPWWGELTRSPDQLIKPLRQFAKSFCKPAKRFGKAAKSSCIIAKSFGNDAQPLCKDAKP
ncbi:MAG: hypothetical protein PHE55_20650, partial [Methylococcaceae bacterium]|nr:hypothetical protein [Methylococcaceae bacterium]